MTRRSRSGGLTFCPRQSEPVPVGCSGFHGWKLPPERDCPRPQRAGSTTALNGMIVAEPAWAGPQDRPQVACLMTLGPRNKRIRMKPPIGWITCGWLLTAALNLATGQTPESVTLQDGKVLAKYNGETKPLERELVFPGEIKVMTNGVFTVQGGKKRKLGEGQVLRSDGRLINPDGTTSPVYDHIIKFEGKMWIVKDGERAPIVEPMTLANGIQVHPEGKMVHPDNTPQRLIDGQMLTLDGSVIPVLDTITLQGGQVKVQKDGSLLPVPRGRVMVMSDGTRVHGDGRVEMADGKAIQLSENQIIFVPGAVLK